MSKAAPIDPEPHDHHFVPQGFLKQWCGNDNQLCRIRKERGKIHCRRIGPKGVAFRKDLYNLKDLGDSAAVSLTLLVLIAEHGRPVNELNFEKDLMLEIDTRGLQAHRKFLVDPRAPVDTQALYDLLRFLYVLRARNPIYLEHIQNESVSDLERLLRAANLEENHLVNVDDMRRDFNAAKLSVVEAILNESEFKRRFDEMACILCDSDPSIKAFITSDMPFVEMGGSPRAIHLAPLSPSRCLIMSRNVELIHGLKRSLNDQTVTFVNCVLMTVSRELYALDERERAAANQYLGLYYTDPQKAARALGELATKALGLTDTQASQVRARSLVRTTQPRRPTSRSQSSSAAVVGK
jgi:hypothetical protein